MKALSKKGLDFVMGKHFASFSTIHRDGSPHTTPIWYMYEDGKFIVNTSLERVKVKNVMRDDRVALLVHEAYSYLLVEGRARIANERDPLKDIESLAIRYHGEEKGRRDARNYYWKQKRVSIEVVPRKFVEQLD
jgi:PPOX class probable F420-dependent enzyme